MERLRTVRASAALFVLLAIIFLVQRATGALDSDARMLAFGALPDRGGLEGEYWRLLTFGFLHSGAMHLMLNGLLLLPAGPAVERRVGPAPLGLIFLAASIASGVGILVKHQLWPASGVSVGASGGMFGLLGAALILVWRAPGGSALARFGLAAILAGALAYSLLPGVSLVGHLVGLAVGAAAGILIRPRRPATKTEGSSPSGTGRA